ncbi:unnamed protein product, partial [Symbiodinium sp. KB8]
MAASVYSMGLNFHLKRSLLPEPLFTQFPTEEPRRFAHMPNIGVYGTSCAAWDQVPGTPLSSRCAPGSDWSSPDFNWCQLPWCYVASECPSRIPTRVFNGSMAYYSYDTCGNAPDCYSHFHWDHRCPYDPHGGRTFRIHKNAECDCLFHGSLLPHTAYSLHPLNEAGKFANLTHISIYGCRSRVVSTVFSGSAAAYRSYDTCLSTPDCSDLPYDNACPFDWTYSSWSTPAQCAYNWSDVCKFKDYRNIETLLSSLRYDLRCVGSGGFSVSNKTED